MSGGGNLNKMRFFQFKINAEIDAFAISLAEDYIKAYSLETEKSSKKNKKKLSRANDLLSDKIKRFKIDNKLGVYRKARVGNKFMWALREHGFEKELSEDVTKKLFYILNEK